MTSKRDIERRLDRIDDGKDYPNLTLCEFLSADEIEGIETDDGRDLARIDGQIYDGTGLFRALEDRLAE